MISQCYAPLIISLMTTHREEREAMTQLRSELRAENDRANLRIRDCASIDEDEGPRAPVVVRGEKMQ